MNINPCEYITENVTMDMILQQYYYTSHKKRIKCPIHNGEDDNFCYTDKVYHCWVCGAKGNVITFVKNFFDIDTKQAVSKINYDLNLQIPINRPLNHRDKIKMRESTRKRKEMVQHKVIEKQKKIEEYWEIFDEWKRLSDNKRKYAPKRPDEELHPLFVEACHKLDYQEYLLDKAEIKRCTGE